MVGITGNPVTVEELQIVISAEVVKALSELKRFQEKYEETVSNMTAGINKNLGGVAKNISQPLNKAKDQLGKAAGSMSQAVKEQVSEVARQQKEMGKAFEGSGQQMRQMADAAGKAGQKTHQAFDKVRQSAEDAEEVVKRLIQREREQAQMNSQVDIQREEPPGEYRMATSKKAAPKMDSQPQAQQLTLLQKIAAQYYAKLDAIKGVLHKLGAYGQEGFSKVAAETTKASSALNGVKGSAVKASISVKKVGSSASSSAGKASQAFIKLYKVIREIMSYASQGKFSKEYFPE